MFHVKHQMNDYIVILKIILAVISGKNLTEVFQQNIQSNDVNPSKVKDICYGVVRNYFSLSLILDKLTTKKPQPDIAVILMIAIYEINFTKKPVYAITNDIVNLTFELHRNLKLKNFTNAVLRNYLRNQNLIIKKPEYKYNFPVWFINKMKVDYPENWEEIIKFSNLKPTISLRTNPKKTTLDKYSLSLTDNSISHAIKDKVIILENTIAVDKIPSFSEGYVSIQDVHAQKLINFFKFKNNQYILDACSAPGGKSCQILENYDVDIVALDIDKDRLERVQQNLDRLDLTARTICADATALDWWDKNPFDVIIADVPCSASGTIKRNPDIKLHRQESDIKNFVDIQRKIVINLWKTLKTNGHMVYITCSIFKEENQGNINFFQHNLIGANIIKEMQVLPDSYGDGFYYCILEKVR